MLLTIALRYGVLLAGLGFGGIAMSSWQKGAPPAWSFLSPRMETVIHGAAIESGLIANGTARHHVRVIVQWPAGSSGRQELASVHPRLANYHIEEAQALLREYAHQRPITVRVIAGQPHADRSDRFHLAHAIVSSLFALLLTTAGLFSFFAFRGPEADRRA